MKRHLVAGLLLLLNLFALGQDANSYADDGVSKCKIGSYSKAISALNKAIIIDPTNSEALYFRGIAKFEMGDYCKKRSN